MKFKLLIAFLIFIFLFFGLPNLINTKERLTFDREERVLLYKSDFDIKTLSDSITTCISDFYETSAVGEIVLGKHHRPVWSTEVKLPVFKGFDTLSFVKSGGGQQTTSVELRGKDKKRYSLRSINKDNSNAIPDFLKASLARPFIRDQASALNPYAAPVVSSLLDALNIQHPKPRIYFVPFRQPLDSISILVGGEVVILVEELNKKWKNSNAFDYPDQILNTNDLLERSKKGSVKIDARLYLRSRLFDFLVSDWDRHEKQWKWGIYDNLAQPIPIDRDMAFCKFNDGLASRFVRLFNNKFQSFTTSDYNISGLTRNSLPLDKKILTDLENEDFTREVLYLQEHLTDAVIQGAFHNYPPEIYNLIGAEHIATFRYRLKNLTLASQSFFKLLQESD